MLLFGWCFDLGSVTDCFVGVICYGVVGFAYCVFVIVIAGLC